MHLLDTLEQDWVSWFQSSEVFTQLGMFLCPSWAWVESLIVPVHGF